MVKYNKICLCMYVCMYVYTLSLVQATGRTTCPFKVGNSSNDAFSGVDVPFGGEVDAKTFLGVIFPQKPPKKGRGQGFYSQN